MKTIFMTISRGSLIRNFFHTGLVSKLLEKGVRVVVLTPNADSPELFGRPHKNLFFEFYDEPKYSWKRRLIKEFLKASVFNPTVHLRYRYRVSGAKPNLLFYFFRILLLVPAAHIPGFKPFIRWIDFCINPEKEYDFLFKKYKPSLVFVTSIGGDTNILKSAKRFGVKTMGMPKSWDNLSKFLFPVKVDKMLVWGNFMKKQAVKFQGYKSEEVAITGGPQFDYYVRKEFLASRDEFCKKHNLDPRKKIILYSSAGGNECCDEPQYLEILKKFIDSGRLKNVQVLIRPHIGYKNDKERFLRFRNYENFAVDETDSQSIKFKDRWDVSVSHLDNLFNSIYHSDVSINVMSTLTLDSIYVGTPVININFDSLHESDPNMSAKRLYISDYAKALVASGGSWVAESEAEFLAQLEEILERGGGEQSRYEKIVSDFLYKVDGKAGDRIISEIYKALA
jgi:hypothetical protein